MAEGMVYSVQLKLNVEDSQLDNAIAKLRLLKREAKGVNVHVGGMGAAVGGYGRRLYAPPRVPRLKAPQTPAPKTPDGWFWGSRFTSHAGFLAGMKEFQARLGTLQSNFFNNVSSFSGLRYNTVNLGKTFVALSGVVGKTIPIIGQMASIGGMFVKAYGAMVGWNLLSSGLPLYAGTRALNSASMNEAASNLMQMRMAEKGLGGNYKPTLLEATRLATEYGFSRVGMLNAMNMFTGLNVDGHKLSSQEAAYMAEVIGKIAHVGGLSFERVNVNLQQLLGQAVPSIRDIRELVGQAPFIGKLAMNRMEREGVTGDYREWLKNKSNLRAVLDEFNELVESHPVMKARGQIALAKENFWMNIADNLSPYWGKIAEANEKLYGWLGDKIVGWISKIDPEKFGNKLDDFVVELNGLVNAVGPLVSKLVHWADKISGVAKERFPELVVDEYGNIKHTGRTLAGSAGQKAMLDKQLEARERVYDLELPKIKDIVSSTLLAQGIKFHNDELENWLKSDNIRSMFTLNADNFSWRKWVSGMDVALAVANARGRGVSAPTPLANEEYIPAMPAIVDLAAKYADFLKNADNQEQFRNLFGNPTEGVKRDMEDVSKGQRALFITFNKELINMPVNIAQANDVDDIARKLQPKIEETLISGLQRVLNNATGTL